MLHRHFQLAEPALTIQELCVKQILMVLIQGCSMKVFIIPVTDRYCCTLEHVGYPFVETSIFSFSSDQR